MTRVTFGALYRQALIPGGYAEWRELCKRAAQQGFSQTKVEGAVLLATITDLGVVAVVLALVGWLS